MFQRRKYQRYIATAEVQQMRRMGYPLMGAVTGFFTNKRWVKTTNEKQTLLPHQLADLSARNPATTMMFNIGDPASAAKDEAGRLKQGVYYPEDIENDVIKIFAHHFNVSDEGVKGYVATGGTEGNLAAIWWLRNAMMNLGAKKRPVMIASDQSHYSSAKIAGILNLELVSIKSNVAGEIDLSALQEEMQLRLSHSPDHTFIVWLNAGTTVRGAIDDIARVKQLLDAHFNQAMIRIHIDGAVLGAALPFLMPTVASIFNYTDSISISGHKLLATPLACGIVLAKKEIVAQAFANKDTSVGYVHGIHDITVSGCRSVLPIIQLHMALNQFGLPTDAKNFQTMLLTCLKNASYFAHSLKEIIGDEHVFWQSSRLNVIFPLLMNESDAEQLKDKYTLMPLPDNHVCVTVFLNVDKKLTNEFLQDYKEMYEKNLKGQMKPRAKL